MVPMLLKLKAHAANQHGIITRSQVLESGLSDFEIDRLIRRNEWVTVRRGAYMEHDKWDAMTADERHKALVNAVVLKLGGEFVISHASAGIMHNLPAWDIDLDDVHVTRPRGSSTRKQAGIWHHAAAVPDDQLIEPDGIRVTTGTRTVLDTARVSSFESSVAMADAALREGLTTAEQLLDTLNGMRDWPGARNAGRVVEFADALAESVGESLARIVMDAAGLPEPALQVVLRTGDRVDFLFDEQSTVVEFDGKQKYGRLLGPDDDPAEVIWREKKREDRIRELGYEVVRLIWADLKDVEGVGRRIRRAFSRAHGRNSRY
jgi:very-short-patch-repair endonuclease